MRRTTILAAALLALVPIAGCLGGDDDGGSAIDDERPEFDSAQPVGSSEMRVEVLDDARNVIANDTVTIGSNENATLDLSAVHGGPGDHTLHITLGDGAANFAGEVRVYDAETPVTDRSM